MINEYFNDFFETDLSEKFNDKIAILEEIDNKKVDDLRSFSIDCKPINFKMIKSDKITVNKLFKGKGQGQKKHCDYLIITDNKVFFIELQTSFDNDRDNGKKYIINQFKGTLCITDYIDSVLYNFYNKDKYFKKIEKRYILFIKRFSIDKTDTSRKDLRKESNDKPDKFKIIKVNNEEIVQFEILG